jgi:MFS family permease
MASTPQQPEPTLRSLGLSVYLPTLLFSVGQGAVIPIVALAARDLGASPAVAGLVVALRGIGILSFDVPAGWLVSRFGERRAMAVASALVIVSLAGSVWTSSLVLFAGFTFLMGCGWSVWLLARLTFVSDTMPLRLRGRALSTLGGINRIGNFVGPFVGAGLSSVAGLAGAYYVHIGTAMAASAVLFAVVRKGDEGPGLGRHEPVPFGRIVRDHKRVFLTAGVGSTAIGTLRASRQAVVPLWADHVGLSASATSVVYGISTGMEVLLFYPAGSAMDRFGRKSVAIPCLATMSVGMMLLPLTHAFWTLALVGLLIGFGNGLGSGIVMTLGADFSPAIGRAQFLGAWRVCGDIGTAGGPLGVAGVTAAVTLGGAAVLVGLVGLAGAAVIFFLMPEPLRMARDEAPTRGP